MKLAGDSVEWYGMYMGYIVLSLEGVPTGAIWVNKTDLARSKRKALPKQISHIMFRLINAYLARDILELMINRLEAMNASEFQGKEDWHRLSDVRFKLSKGHMFICAIQVLPDDSGEMIGKIVLYKHIVSIMNEKHTRQSPGGRIICNSIDDAKAVLDMMDRMITAMEEIDQGL